MDAEPANAEYAKEESLAGASSRDGSSTSDICASCRQPLPSEGLGQCLRCLANFALLPDDEELEEEPASGETLGTGTRRYGHFEIVTAANGFLLELGHGAMGTTYRARDTVLHSAVALKIIDRKVAEHPAARARFLREARAAAQLRHPNVASVYHFGEQAGECFYGMELVEGETLEEYVRREGPLPGVLALEITAQVARALAAAEARGIIHRDLKPSNVMLVAASEAKTNETPVLVKIIDFGLAKAVAAWAEVPGPADTRGGFVGTPAFASPEQFTRAEDERIDTRSDIYSLGVTLWYLLCGKLPFVGQTLTEIHQQQTRQSLPSDQLKAANVPQPIIALLRSMLAVAPVARPQSARELLNLCNQCQAQLSPASRASRRRLASWAAACCLLFVITAITLAAWWRGATPAAGSPNPSVAVLPFENLSPDPSNAFFTRGIHDAIAADLARIGQLRVIGGDSVKPYVPGKPRDLSAISRALGVADLVEASVRRDDGRVRIELRLVGPRISSPIWSAKYDRPLTEEFTLLSEITRTLAEHLQTPPSRDEIASIERRPTHDPVAYDLYLRSKEGPTVFPTETKLRQHAQQEISLLDNAVARDPGFVLAYCALAKWHDDMASRTGQATPEELAVDHRALAEKSLARARRLQPDSGEVHIAYASHYFAVTHDFEHARIEADLARRTLPNNVKVENVSGQVALRQGRWDDAVRSLERMVALDPRSLASHAQLEETYEFLRRYDDADRELAVMESLLPPAAVVTLPSARAMLALEGRADLAPLRAAVAELTDAQDPDRDLRDSYGVIIAVFEHDESRLRYVLAASKMNQYGYAGFEYPKAWFEALAARMRKDDAAAQTAFTAARSELQKTVLANARDERNLLLLAMIDAGLGNKKDAVSEAQSACAMTPLESERVTAPADRCCLAVVYAWTDQAELAFAELDKLVSGPAGANIPNQPTYGDLRLNPLWDPLRADSRFDALVEKLAPDKRR